MRWISLRQIQHHTFYFFSVFVYLDSADAADTLVDLMQMFRDKKNIFGNASELLCRLISASTAIKVM